MQDFFCETLDLDFRLATEKFDKDAFLADVQNVANRDTRVHNYAYGSTTRPDKQHAHISVDLRGKTRFRFRITYHSFPGETDDTRPPYMEDCAQWLGRFMTEEEIPATLHAVYVFDRTFSPIVPLPFPLLANSKQLAGSKVTGLSLQLPREMGIQRAMIEREKDETSIQIHTNIKVKLRDFALTSQLESLAIPIMSLVSPIAQEKEGQ